MDRRGKERLIGAGVLVALAVVVVPELLSGPKPPAPALQAPRFPDGAPDPVRNVTVDLTTSKPAELAGAAPSMPDAPAPAPVPVTPQVRPLDGLPVVDSHPDAHPAAVPAVPTAPAPATGAYSVQLGSFANRGNADNLVHQLKAQGFAVYESSEGAGAAARYRVRVGPMSDRDSAQRTLAKLKTQGLAATIVGPR